MLADLLNKCVQAFHTWGISHALRSVLSNDGMGSMRQLMRSRDIQQSTILQTFLLLRLE